MGWDIYWYAYNKGLDVHDVGKHLSKITEETKNISRNLEEGMVITVEPGCYFIPYLWYEGAKKQKIDNSYLNMEALKEYVSFGGVRVEDNIHIQSNGSENLTHLPRTTSEIENYMSNTN